MQTIGGFLRESGMKYRVFSLGRRVAQLTPESFVSFERSLAPCPQPFQKRAFLGFIFWHPENESERHVWFLKFPLDEAGMLIQSAQESFLEILSISMASSKTEGAMKKPMESTLEGNPYAFMPRNDKKIAFYALAKKNLKLPPSDAYEEATAYFIGEKAPEEWQHLKLEGIADLAVRLNTTDKSLDLVRALPRVPDEPFGVLSAFWEHASPDISVVEVLAQRVAAEVEEKKPNIKRIIGWLRACSNSQAQGLVKQIVDKILSSSCGRETEILAIISGRCWEVLRYPDSCLQFVEQLAKNTTGQSVFNHIISDVIHIPGMKKPIMKALESPKCSRDLERASGLMFAGQGRLSAPKKYA